MINFFELLFDNYSELTEIFNKEINLIANQKELNFKHEEHLSNNNIYSNIQKAIIIFLESTLQLNKEDFSFRIKDDSIYITPKKENTENQLLNMIVYTYSNSNYISNDSKLGFIFKPSHFSFKKNIHDHINALYDFLPSHTVIDLKSRYLAGSYDSVFREHYSGMCKEPNDNSKVSNRLKGDSNRELKSFVSKLSNITQLACKYPERIQSYLFKNELFLPEEIDLLLISNDIIVPIEELNYFSIDISRYLTKNTIINNENTLKKQNSFKKTL